MSAYYRGKSESLERWTNSSGLLFSWDLMTIIKTYSVEYYQPYPLISLPPFFHLFFSLAFSHSFNFDCPFFFFCLVSFSLSFSLFYPSPHSLSPSFLLLQFHSSYPFLSDAPISYISFNIILSLRGRIPNERQWGKKQGSLLSA